MIVREFRALILILRLSYDRARLRATTPGYEVKTSILRESFIVMNMPGHYDETQVFSVPYVGEEIDGAISFSRAL
jgi:hypothetical protein